MPDTLQFTNGNQIVHHYDAMGNRLRTTYYTRKVALVEPATNTIPGTDNLQEYNMVSYITLGNKRYVRYGHDGWGLQYVYNPEGYIKYWGEEEHYPYYYIKDHLGSVRETYIRPYVNEKYCEQRMQYYPSGLPWNTNLSPSYQPFKYGGKEFVEMHGLDEYDSEARWYYPAIMRTTTMDPMCEDYYSISPYAWCSNNPVNYIDPDGRDVYIFNLEGEYEYKIIQEGAHVGMILDNNQPVLSFEFADPINDPKAIDEGIINKVLLVTDEQISQILKESGVYDLQNKDNKYTYAYNESDAGNVKGEGLMDYVATGMYKNAEISKYSAYLFITYNSDQKVAHNNYNFGNFLWGAGMSALEIPFFIAKLGSNVNNFFRDINSKWHLDSSDDQFSIKLGYLWQQKHKYFNSQF